MSGQEDRQLQPHQERVVHEAQALNQKVIDLENFTKGAKFKELETADRVLLVRQLELMISYLAVLKQRIERF